MRYWIKILRQYDKVLKRAKELFTSDYIRKIGQGGAYVVPKNFNPLNLCGFTEQGILLITVGGGCEGQDFMALSKENMGFDNVISLIHEKLKKMEEKSIVCLSDEFLGYYMRCHGFKGEEGVYSLLTRLKDVIVCKKRGTILLTPPDNLNKKEMRFVLQEYEHLMIPLHLRLKQLLSNYCSILKNISPQI